MRKLSIVFFILFTVAITSCTPQEIKYFPAENSLMQIEFLYPAHWSWERKIVANSFESLTINDPEWVTPTHAIRPDFYLEQRIIHIFVGFPSENYTVEEEMRLSVELSSTEDWPIGSVVYILNDDIFFKELPGKHILTKREYYSLDRNAYTGEYVEYYFFRTADRWYRVMMIIPVDERNGTFGRAFDRIIETIEIRNP